nr:PREDICTED: O-acetyl-ADP-ribose deacetylase 1-like [Latimeria chalumnae]|eukprot:XP_006009857.1 PREDICTED: O-acetyl-ADP-ribose deacetylase 1-like [Latimeria chalumnae]
MVMADASTAALGRVLRRFSTFHFQYREIDGDLMQCPSTDSMAISMNKSFYMSSGVAKQFQEQFGRLQELKSQNKKVGEVAVLEDGKRYLYYMITRSTYSYKPRYEDLEKCLQVVKAHCVENKVVCLSMPSFLHQSARINGADKQSDSGGQQDQARSMPDLDAS